MNDKLRAHPRFQARIPVMRLTLVLLACATQFLGTASGASAGAAELRVTYQEVRSASVVNAAALMRQVATRERSAIQGACCGTGTCNVELLQELGRPERWVLLERTCEALSPGAPLEYAGSSALEALQVAPVQALLHHELTGVTGTQRNAWADLDPAHNDIYEVTHVDIGGPGVSLSDIDNAIRSYIAAARAAAGNLRAEAWRLDGHANHSTLLFIWKTQAARGRFSSGADTYRFRAQIARGLGAPYDDRLYRRID